MKYVMTFLLAMACLQGSMLSAYRPTHHNLEVELRRLKGEYDRLNRKTFIRGRNDQQRQWDEYEKTLSSHFDALIKQYNDPRLKIPNNDKCLKLINKIHANRAIYSAVYAKDPTQDRKSREKLLTFIHTNNLQDPSLEGLKTYKAPQALQGKIAAASRDYMAAMVEGRNEGVDLGIADANSTPISAVSSTCARNISANSRFKVVRPPILLQNE